MTALEQLRMIRHPNYTSTEADAICIAADVIAAQLTRIADVLEHKFGRKQKLPASPVRDHREP